MSLGRGMEFASEQELCGTSLKEQRTFLLRNNPLCNSITVHSLTHEICTNWIEITVCILYTHPLQGSFQ